MNERLAEGEEASISAAGISASAGCTEDYDALLSQGAEVASCRVPWLGARRSDPNRLHVRELADTELAQLSSVAAALYTTEG